ncbi:MAG: phosphotransferase [Kofleriaceae bacterium]
MATFTHLSADDAAVIAAAAGLGGVTAVTPIAAGTINSNFAFTTATGRWFVRVNEGKRVDDVAWEAALVARLAAAGLATPPPRTIDGRPWLEHRGLLVSVFPWVVGAIRPPDDVTAADAATLGAALGRLHRVAADHPGRPGIYRWADIVARLRGLDPATAPALAPALATLAPVVAAVDGAAAVRAAAGQGIIHGDLFRDNVLWRGPALVALLDFEQAATGSLVYDVAVAVNDWCWDGARVDPARAQALVAGHRAVIGWSAADRAAFAWELTAAAVRFTVTRITDVYLRQVDNPDKDYRAFLARVAWWRSPVGSRLSEMLAG